MTFIARIELGSSLVQAGLEAVPHMVLHLEDIRQTSDHPRRNLYWASGNDFEAFETALTEDPTVESFQCLTDLREERLYRIMFSEAGERKSIYPIIVEQDITLIDVKQQGKFIHILARFPSRDALVNLRNGCRDRAITFHLKQLYREEPTANDGGTASRFGVTDPQREALLHALEAGYFSVPRRTKLETIAMDLGISTTSVSARLRRGQQNLVRHTLAQEPII